MGTPWRSSIDMKLGMSRDINDQLSKVSSNSDFAITFGVKTELVGQKWGEIRAIPRVREVKTQIVVVKLQKIDFRGKKAPPRNAQTNKNSVCATACLSISLSGCLWLSLAVSPARFPTPYFDPQF